jgi:hypothetical protein
MGPFRIDLAGYPRNGHELTFIIAPKELVSFRSCEVYAAHESARPFPPWPGAP